MTGLSAPCSGKRCTASCRSPSRHLPQPLPEVSGHEPCQSSRRVICPTASSVTPCAIPPTCGPSCVRRCPRWPTASTATAPPARPRVPPRRLAAPRGRPALRDSLPPRRRGALGAGLRPGGTPERRRPGDAAAFAVLCGAVLGAAMAGLGAAGGAASRRCD